MHETHRGALDSVRGIFRSVVRTVVPEAEGMSEGEWAELESIVDDALRQRPPGMRRQLRIFLRAIRWLPVLRWGRRFPALSRDARTRFLRALQDAPLLLVRRGFWGVRTLAFMGYYGREAARDEIGYDARLRGRRDRDVPVAGRRRGALPEETPREDGP